MFIINNTRVICDEYGFAFCKVTICEDADAVDFRFRGNYI